MQIQGVNRVIISTCVIGLLVSTYALYVEMAAEARPGYKALCDIAEHASCSKVLTSPYGKGLGLLPDDSSLKIPNCIYGILFYCSIILLTTFDKMCIVRIQIGLSMGSLIMCVYLAYILVFVLQDFCVVCVSTYFFNAGIAIFLNKKYNLLSEKHK